MNERTQCLTNVQRAILLGVVLFVWIILALCRQLLFASPAAHGQVLAMLGLQLALATVYAGTGSWQLAQTAESRLRWLPSLLAVLVSGTSLVSLYVWLWFQA